MAEGTVLQTMTGATLAISASLPATYDAAGYGATGISFTTVGSVENYGSHGGSANVASFTAVGDGVVQSFKGAVDYGTKSVVCGYMPSDAGQDLLDAAFDSKSRYSLKVTYPARTGESTGEIHYLDVLVVRREWQDGAADDVRKVNYDLKVCRAPVRVAGS
jgi:hypothetical protein